VPFHRADGVTHLLDLTNATETTAAVVALDGSKRYASLAEFMAEVVTSRN
jgi:hypothetical protein